MLSFLNHDLANVWTNLSIPSSILRFKKRRGLRGPGDDADATAWEVDTCGGTGIGGGIGFCRGFTSDDV